MIRLLIRGKQIQTLWTDSHDLWFVVFNFLRLLLVLFYVFFLYFNFKLDSWFFIRLKSLSSRSLYNFYTMFMWVIVIVDLNHLIYIWFGYLWSPKSWSQSYPLVINILELLAKLKLNRLSECMLCIIFWTMTRIFFLLFSRVTF